MLLHARVELQLCSSIPRANHAHSAWEPADSLLQSRICILPDRIMRTLGTFLTSSATDQRLAALTLKHFDRGFVCPLPVRRYLEVKSNIGPMRQVKSTLPAPRLKSTASEQGTIVPMIAVDKITNGNAGTTCLAGFGGSVDPICCRHEGSIGTAMCRSVLSIADVCRISRRFCTRRITGLSHR
jgi:hypothetical protein